MSGAPKKDFTTTIRKTFGLEEDVVKKPAVPDVSIPLDSFPEDVRDVVQIFDKDGYGSISRAELAIAAGKFIITLHICFKIINNAFG